MSVVGGLGGAEALLLLLLPQIRVTKHGLWLYTVQTAKARCSGAEVTLLLLHIPEGGISGSTKTEGKEKAVVEVAALKSSVITRPQRSSS